MTNDIAQIDEANVGVIQRDIPRQLSISNVALSAIVALAIVHALVVLVLGIDKPPLDLHAFRQTQTALSAYWILKGGPWIAYETPVFGAPWSIPFEFPVYQLLTAALSLLGIPLDMAGRLVGYAFFLGILWPLHIVFSECKLGRPSYLATCILFLTCPIYLYWSRTILVESCALFFAALWLAMVVRYLNRRGWVTAVVGIAAGSVALLAKATTFPAFAAIGCLIVAMWVVKSWLKGDSVGSLVGLLSVVAALVALPFAVGVAWVVYSDHIKLANEFGQHLTSAALTQWNFGTLKQRMGPILWAKTIQERVIPETLGNYSLAAFVVIGACLTSTRTLLAIGLAVIGFLIPFLVFTNVHIIHNYYQSANAIFLIAGVGLGIGRLVDLRQRAVALVFLAVIAFSQLSLFYVRFAPEMMRDFSQDRLLRISTMAKETTHPGESLLVIGDDWASTVPYLSERKALVLAYWTPAPLLKRILTAPQDFLGDQPLGGIVFCGDNVLSYGAMSDDVRAFTTGRATLAQFGGCEVLAPTKGAAP